MHEHVNTKITSIFILMEAHESSTGETQAENETQRIPRLYVSQLQYEHVVIVVYIKCRLISTTVASNAQT